MLFLGIDLGWTVGASGLATLRLDGDRLLLTDSRLAATHADVVRWVEEQAADGPALLAIDAPTIIRNPAGQRPGERELNEVFRRHLLNCHPANLGRPFAALTTGLSNTFEQRGFLHADRIAPRVPGRYQIEVFPHAAIVRLFGLQHRIRYKKGNVAERAAALNQLRNLMRGMDRLSPPCITGPLPEVPLAGRARKAVEDRLDAIVCAYVGAHYWWWGAARNTVFGDAEGGFLVVPEPRACATLAQEKRTFE